MIARIKATGEIIDVSFPLDGGVIRTTHPECYMKRSEIDVLGYSVDEYLHMKDKLEHRNPIDWEHRRYEIAKDMLCALRGCSNEYISINGTLDSYCNESIEAADALIERLKKEN